MCAWFSQVVCWSFPVKISYARCAPHIPHPTLVVQIVNLAIKAETHHETQLVVNTNHHLSPLHCFLHSLLSPVPVLHLSHYLHHPPCRCQETSEVVL